MIRTRENILLLLELKHERSDSQAKLSACGLAKQVQERRMLNRARYALNKAHVLLSRRP
ncbi:MAG: hypothetical protein WCK08_13185 [Betaproteobacteria bacterium]